MDKQGEVGGGDWKPSLLPSNPKRPMASDDRQEASSMEENEGRNSHKKYTSPFSQFDISPTHVLDTIQKMHCPTCNRNVRYFCNRCLHLVNCPDGAVPQIKLPIKIDIIKHEKERDGKSTALHAKILAPDDVQVYGWKTKPDYDQDVDRLLLLFPGPVRIRSGEGRRTIGLVLEGLIRFLTDR
jgi:hypothetical protein